MIKKIFSLLFPSFMCKKIPSWERKLKGRLISGKKNVKIGKGCVISGNVEFKEGVTLEDYVRIIGIPIIKLGRNVYINCFTMMCGEINIGDNTMISQFVNMWGKSHQYNDKDKPIWVQHGEGGQGYKVAPITIKESTWIGPHVTILRGVTIGKGAVVAANAVVTKDIPDFAVVMGVPAKVVKFRK